MAVQTTVQAVQAVQTAARKKRTVRPAERGVMRNPNTFDGRILSAAHQDEVMRLTHGAGLPLLSGLRCALQNGQVVGDYAGQPTLQAAAALLPMYEEAELPSSLRAIGCGADGQGTVLTPPVLDAEYTQQRHFLRMALRWAGERYASYHVWAVLPLVAETRSLCEENCAQYISAGLTLCAVCPLGEVRLLVFSAHAKPRWQGAMRRVGLYDARLPRLLECRQVAADFGWGTAGMELILRPAR